MDVTIKDILDLPELNECRLLDKSVSCQQKVKSITIMDNPDILNWMTECEILLSNGSSLADLNVLEWKAFFEGLVKKKAAALFIKLKYYVQSIPSEAVEYAIKLDFPIVIVPNSYSWVRLSNPIQNFMIERQFYFLNESLHLRNELNRAMTLGGSAESICKIASADMDCQVAYFSKNDWNFLGGISSDIWNEAIEMLRLSESDIYRQLNVSDSSNCEFRMSSGTVIFTRLPDRQSRYVSAYYFSNEDEFSKELDGFKIEQVNSALLLCIGKEEELRRVERRYYMEFLADVLDGDVGTNEQIATRTKRLGRTVHETYRLIVARGGTINPDDLISDLVTLFKQDGNPIVKDVMCCLRDSSVVLFSPSESEEDKDVIERVCKITSRKFRDEHITFGVSSSHPIGRLSKALEEARFACSMQVFNKNEIVYYDNLGLLRLFEQVGCDSSTQFVSDYYETVFGPIARYDQEYGSDLCKTLKSYFDNDSSIVRASKALFVHENTLRMRIKRIESLTGRSLKTTLGSTELYLATVLDEFMHEG